MPALGGHGVGRTIHEEPSVHNYYASWDDEPLTEGLVLAIDPVISAGSGVFRDAGDGWTVVTADGTDSAHFEHTVVITRGRPLVLTA
jgi:methionyl aminopeptidase